MKRKQKPASEKSDVQVANIFRNDSVTQKTREARIRAYKKFTREEGFEDEVARRYARQILNVS